MFGYVNINKPELKMKDFYRYKAYYCGLCNVLRDKYGTSGQMTLSYDMTFLILLLTSLYEEEPVKSEEHCIIHPIKKHEVLVNSITEYVADMNILLTYHHLEDDWQDEKSLLAFAGSKLFVRKYRRISKQYERQTKVIVDSLDELTKCEKHGETNIDLVSRCFGELMAELFVYRKDMWEESLREMGFYLGKFIYILDAYDDLEKDKKNGSYNPLLPLSGTDTFDEEIRTMLTMMIAESTKAFERLPCLVESEILRNILYDGVWVKFEQIQKERMEKEGNTNDSRSI